MCFICVSKINALISTVKALSSPVLIGMLAYFVDFYHTVIGGQGYSVTAVMCYD